MKQAAWIFLAAVMLCPFRADAQSEDVLATCEMLGDTSDSIFTAKNNGMALTELMRRINGAVEDRGAIYDLTMTMIREIYGLPNYSTPEFQAQQAARYRASVELQCFESLGDL